MDVNASANILVMLRDTDVRVAYAKSHPSEQTRRCTLYTYISGYLWGLWYKMTETGRQTETRTETVRRRGYLSLEYEPRKNKY